ncbi:acyltransferase family protein [Amnibacterium kyonggiense]|uniref:Surface polysaccharide O-acyltransferase-like enzyme n=1 Tax=Amnibacterium kyonggiense TaxID=595671 RepID=A0A4R7FSQ4_9MICO|nr:acyltransferase [Amnibacterium kyonggiense]TDS80836.1 surface polysaccharide O-acyltransferase-like enzyme [Amnibacterium kyonggiense]
MAEALTAADRQRLLAGRDLSVDLVRVCCVLLVVVLHSLMLGLTVGPAGAIGWRNVVQEQPWFAVASWFGQLMPLFFVVGGFASWQGWRSTQRKGGTGADFFRARLLRLGTPAAVWFVIVGAVVWLAGAAGLPADLLANGLGLPLWFLAAYLVCQAAVPLMIRLHTTHPAATFATLLAGVVLVDAVRGSTGVQTVGLLNLLLVWPLVQQIGFLLADGTLGRLRRPALLGLATVAFGTVGVLASSGLYSPDMLDDLNPPTLPLVLIGVGQTALFVLVKPALDGLMRTRPAQAFVGIAGTRLMTVYLWHLLLVIAVAATVLAWPSVVPAVGTTAWWLARIPGDLSVLVVLFVLSLGLARFERGPKRVGPVPATPVLVVAGVLAVVPPFWAMEVGLDRAAFVWGAAAMVGAVLLARGRVGRGASDVPTR